MIKSIALLIRSKQSKNTSFFTTFVARSAQIGIILGVSALIVVMSVMNGFKSEMVQNFLNNSPHIIMLPELGAKKPKIMPKFASFAYYPIEAAAAVNGHFLAIKVAASKSVAFGNVLVPEVIMNKYNLEQNQMLQIFSSKITGLLGTPRSKHQTIQAKIMPIWQSNYIYISLELAQALELVQKNQQPEVTLSLKQPDAAEEVAQDLSKNNKSWEIKTWQELHQSFFQLITTQKSMMFLVLFFMVILSSFGLVSSQVMLVQEQRREIAILSTMGMPRFSIMSCYFLQGLRMGMIGLIFGVAVGLILADNVTSLVNFIENITGKLWLSHALYGMDHMPSKILTEDIYMVVSAGIILCAIAPIYPAWLASNSEPIKIFRQEEGG